MNNKEILKKAVLKIRERRMQEGWNAKDHPRNAEGRFTKSGQQGLMSTATYGAMGGAAVGGYGLSKEISRFKKFPDMPPSAKSIRKMTLPDGGGKIEIIRKTWDATKHTPLMRDTKVFIKHGRLMNPQKLIHVIDKLSDGTLSEREKETLLKSITKKTQELAIKRGAKGIYRDGKLIDVKGGLKAGHGRGYWVKMKDVASDIGKKTKYSAKHPFATTGAALRLAGSPGKVSKEMHYKSFDKVPKIARKVDLGASKRYLASRLLPKVGKGALLGTGLYVASKFAKGRPEDL